MLKVDAGAAVRRHDLVGSIKPRVCTGTLKVQGSGTFTGGAFDAARDENSVTFATLDDYDVALKIKVFVEAWTPSAGENDTCRNARCR